MNIFKNKTLSDNIWKQSDVIKIVVSAFVSLGLFVLFTVALRSFYDISNFLVSFIVTSGAILSLILPVVYFAWKRGISMKDFGFKPFGMKWVFISLFLGVFIVFVGAGLANIWLNWLSLESEPLMDIFRSESSQQMWLNVLYFKLFVAILIPVAEEIFFRGVIFRFLRQNSAFWVSALLSSLIFALIHFSLAALPFLLILGFICAWVFERTGSIVLSMIVHVTVNNMAVNFYLMTVLSG